MANLNKVMIIGNLTADPEVRTTPRGTPLTELRLAVNRVSGGQGEGERREEVTFLDVTCWGRTGEIAAQYLAKGRPVFIEGRLQQDSWEDKQTGQRRSRIRIVAENLQLLGSRQGGYAGQQDGGYGGRQESSHGQGGARGGRRYPLLIRLSPFHLFHRAPRSARTRVTRGALPCRRSSAFRPRLRASLPQVGLGKRARSPCPAPPHNLARLVLRSLAPPPPLGRTVGHSHQVFPGLISDVGHHTVDDVARGFPAALLSRELLRCVLF